MKAPKCPSDATQNTREWWGNNGVVYFVSAGSPAVAIKIGMAAQTGNKSLADTMKRRLSQIQTSNHELIKLIGLVYFTNGDYPTRDAEIYERELHIEFEHLQRFKKHARGAEWFTVAPDLIEKISLVSQSPESFDLPVHFTGNA